MTGPEHYAEAQNCIKQGCASDERGDLADAHVWLSLGQIHATLAVAASQALRGHEGLPDRDRKAWYDAAATKTAPAVKSVEDEAAA